MSSTRTHLISTAVMLALAAAAWADGPKVTGKSAAGSADSEPTQPQAGDGAFVNAHFVAYDDGSVGVWGVQSVHSDSGELLSILFDPQARPGDEPGEPDFVLTTSEWSNVRTVMDEAGQRGILGIAAMTKLESGELTGIYFHNSVSVQDYPADPTQPGGPDENPRVRGCDLRFRVIGSNVTLTCKRWPSICPTPPFQCFIILTIYPNGAITIRCDCR